MSTADVTRALAHEYLMRLATEAAASAITTAAHAVAALRPRNRAERRRAARR